MEPTIKALVQYFELDEPELRTTLEDRKDSSYVILKKQLSKDEIADFKAVQEDKEAGSKIKGVWFEDAYIRRYPYNSLACHVLGYTVSSEQGQSGIEEEYNSALSGTDGRSYKYLNEDLEQSTSVKKATDGNTVVSLSTRPCRASQRNISTNLSRIIPIKMWRDRRPKTLACC